ncbi:MAG: protein kinase, partial [Planctomycetes bacterium]|nr:protein kinase [Planctomycetota bacterium]
MPCPRCGGEHPAGTCVSIGDLRTGLARPGRPEAVLDLAPGTLVGGRYRIDAFIGQGGMGVVYRAHDSRPSRSVALKFLAVRDRADESAFARFEKEAELIASLNHLNIIQVIEIGESDGNKYIAMELADGGTLRDLVKKRGKLPVEEASALMKQVGQALSHAHRKGVVHRDLKPANVLLTKEGVPKLCDFGLAKGLTDSEMSRTGYGMGTLGFMSPEQRRDAKGVDHRTDIYSWGATFYQLATGKDPLAWDPEIIPASVAPLIRKCMKEMEERYFSMEEALGAMEQAPSGGHAAVVVEEGTCPQCRKANRLDVRFCEGCGAGLFEKCPKCGAEGRAPIRFCGKCGCDAAKERKYRDHWAQAQKLAEACQFSRAIKEVDAALALCPEETEARQLGDEVRRKMSALDTLRLRLEECWKAKEYEGAEGAARKILEIDPNDDKAKKVVIEAPVLRRKKDAAKALAEARDSLARRDLDAALEAADRACKLDPANANAQAVQADLTERKAKLDETVADAEEHLKARRYEDAVAIADRVLAEWPNSAAEKVKREAQAALDQLRKHLAQGQKALEAGRHEEAATHFEAAVALRPDREVQKKAGTARAIVKRKFVRAAAVAAVVAIAAVVVLATWAAIDNRVKLSRGERVMAEGKFAEAQESFLAVGWVLADRERARGLVSACDRAREAERFERAGQWAEEMRAWEDVLAAAPATRPFRDACARKVEQAYAEAMKRAHDHFDGKRWALALTACDEALRVKPGDAGAEEKKRKIRQAEVDWRYQEAMTRAEKHLAAKEWVQAAEACDEALRVKPGDAGAEEKKRKIRQAEVEW